MATAIKIYANGDLIVGSLRLRRGKLLFEQKRLRVAQEPERTKVSRCDGAEVLLPCSRYDLSTPLRRASIPGLAQFETDLLRSLEREWAVDW